MVNETDFFDWVCGFDVNSQQDNDSKMTMNEQMVLDDLDSCGQPGTFVMSSGLYSFLSLQNHRDDPETGMYFFHPDHLGSTSFITAFDGTPYQHVDYLPFGEVLIDEKAQTWISPYKFNCKELDEESGLYYYGARYYDPKTSVFLGVDPLSDRTPSISPFTYCLNNPVRLQDPDGKWPWENANVREARAFKRKNGGEFHKWKGTNGMKYASVDRNYSTNGVSVSESKVFLPTKEDQRSVLGNLCHSFAQFDNKLEGGHDGANMGRVDRQDAAVASGVIGVMTAGVGLMAETGVVATVGLGLQLVNSIDDIGTNSNGESSLQQVCNSPAAKKTIGDLKTGFSFFNFGSNVSGLVKDPSKAEKALDIGTEVIKQIATEK